MKIYAARTRFEGADAPTTRYFSSAEKAQEYLNKQDNGEYWELNAEVLPYEGCSWDDIKYWNL